MQGPATSQRWKSVKSQRLKAISSAQNSSLRNSQTLPTEKEHECDAFTVFAFLTKFGSLTTQNVCLHGSIMSKVTRVHIRLLAHHHDDTVNN